MRYQSSLQSVAGVGSIEHRPVSYWIDRDFYQGRPVPALTVIFFSRGCTWHGCTMCGFSKETLPDIDAESFLKQFESAYNITDDEFLVKLYVSGSFFNQTELPVEVRDSILETLSQDERVMKVTVESRPEFLKEETLKTVPGRDKLEVAIGLETADDHIRSQCINKGFTFKDYLQGAEIAGKNGLKVKTYLLLKPPHLTEKEAIEDAVRSARVIPSGSQTLSLNPCTVHRHTKVEEMWRDNQYRPPWIWSVSGVTRPVASSQ